MTRRALRLLLLFLLFAAGVQAQDSLVLEEPLWMLELEEVVVTGQYEPQSLKQSVYQVRTIPSDVIEARGATNIQGILNTELGIRFSNDLMLGTSDISIMGMSGQNVKILLDGVPLLDRGEMRESLNQIDMNTVERIEIVEGPLSVIYGSDALAGVINIITRKGMKNDKTIGVTARILEETAGTEYQPLRGEGTHNENVTINWQRNAWYADASVTRNNFGGLKGNREGRQREWLPKDQWLTGGTVGYVNDNLNVWYRLNYLNEKLTDAGAPNANTGIATDKKYTTHRFTHQVHADWDISSAWAFNGVASFQDYSRRTQTTTFNVATGDRFLSPEPGAQDHSAFTSTTFRGTLLHRLSDKISWQPGIDINLNEGMGDRMDERRFIGDYAAFISAEIRPLSFLNIRPGARFIYNTVYNAPPIVPSLNVKMQLSPSLDLRAAYARGFRAPALRELYFYFFDSSHSIIGNPDLEAEHSNSFTTSLVWNRTLEGIVLNTTLGAFYNQYNNMITLGINPYNPSVNTYINIEHSKTTGATLTQSLRHEALSGSVGFAIIGIYNEFSDDVAGLPELMWTPEVNATAMYDFQKSGTTLSAYYKFTGKRSVYELRQGNNYALASREAFHWIDLMARQRITEQVDLNVGVKNLLNVTRLENTSQDMGGGHSTAGPVPMSYGRAFVVGLNFRMN